MEFYLEPNIVVKPLTDRDAAIFYNTIKRNRRFLSKYLDWSLLIDSEGKALEYIVEKTTGKLSVTNLLLGIFQDENLIGSLELQNWNQKIKKAEIGFWMDEKYSHQGVMSKVIVQFLKNAFEIIGINKIYAIYLPTNIHCHHLLEKLGFKIEGILRDETIHNGSLTNVIIASKLKSDK